MALNLEDKKALVAEVGAVAAKAQSVVAAEYRGLTVGQMTELRAKARAQGVYMRVVKNTLARKALAGTAFESVGPEAQGAAGARFLEGRSGRGCARGEGLCEGQRQARGDARVARRAGAARQGSRQGREPADARAGVVAAAGRHEGADRRSSSRTLAAPPAKLVRTLAAYATRSRPPARLTTCLELISGDPTWLSAKTKSSMQFPR